jgi:hypothetical protein
MSQLYIMGRVLHEPGPWGEGQPVAGARVEILSGDEEKRGTDLIMLATTDAKGEFQGLTTEWRGTVLRTVPDPEKPWKTIQVEEPDPDEKLVLKARIRQTTPEGVKVVTRPVHYKDDITPIDPIFVNWGPPERSAIGSINGLACNTPMEFLERTMIEINARRADIKLEAFGQAGEAYLELTAPTARQQRLASAMHLNPQDILRIRTLITCNEADQSCDVLDSFWISLVVSSIIFSPVTGQAAASFGLALLRLLHSGYQILSVGNASVSLNGMGVAIRLANPALKASQVAQAIE